MFELKDAATSAHWQQPPLLQVQVLSSPGSLWAEQRPPSLVQMDKLDATAVLSAEFKLTVYVSEPGLCEYVQVLFDCTRTMLPLMPVFLIGLGFDTDT